MKYIIHSTIETYTEGANMKGRHNRRNRSQSPANSLPEEKKEMDSKIESETNGNLVSSDSHSPSSDEKKDYHRSEAKSSKHGFFHKVRVEREGVSQVTNVNVNIQPDKDDPCTGCFKAIASMFK